MPAPARVDAGTAAQLIPGVRRTMVTSERVARIGRHQHRSTMAVFGRRWQMKMTRTEELTLSLARSARGRAGDGQILVLLAAAFLAATQVRVQVDLSVVFVGACLMGVLSVLERRNVDGIIRKLTRGQD
jgi:hypothetical protein